MLIVLRNCVLHEEDWGGSITHDDFTSNTVSDFSKDRHGSGVSVVKGVGLSTGVVFVNEVQKDLKDLDLSVNNDRRRVGHLLLSKCPQFLAKFRGQYGNHESEFQGQPLKEIYASFLARVISKFVRNVEDDVDGHTTVGAHAADAATATESRASVLADLHLRYKVNSVSVDLFRGLEAMTNEPEYKWLSFEEEHKEHGEEEHEEGEHDDDGVDEEMTSDQIIDADRTKSHSTHLLERLTLLLQMYIENLNIQVGQNLIFTNDQLATEILHRLRSSSKIPTDMITNVFKLRDYLDCCIPYLDQDHVAMVQDAIRSCLVGEILCDPCSQLSMTRNLLGIFAHNATSFSSFRSVALNVAWALLFLGIKEQKSLTEQHREQLKTMSEKLVSHGAQCDSEGSSKLIINLREPLNDYFRDPADHGVTVATHHGFGDDQEETTSGDEDEQELERGQENHEVMSMIDVITTLVNLNKLALNDH